VILRREHESRGDQDNRHRHRELSALAFGLATAIAGVAGVLVAMVFPAFNPFAGDFYSILGFIIIVLGGLGNPLGAMAERLRRSLPASTGH